MKITFLKVELNLMKKKIIGIMIKCLIHKEILILKNLNNEVEEFIVMHVFNT
jgi:hypothetical protein